MKRFGALIGLFVVVALVCAVSTFICPSIQSMTEDKPYMLYPNREKISDFELMESCYQSRYEAGDNPILLFGSSELKYCEGGNHPYNFFAQNNYGVDTMSVGYAFCMDFWHCIELGAFENEGIYGNKVVLSVSPQWFMCYRKPSKYYNACASIGADEAFFANEDISDEIKLRVAKRLLLYGSDVSELHNQWIAQALEEADEETLAKQTSLTAPSPVDTIDDAVEEWAHTARVTNPLTAASEDYNNRNFPLPNGRFDEEQTPNWDTAKAQGEAYAKTQAHNDDGYDDTLVLNGSQAEWVTYARSKWAFKDGEPWSSAEFSDFEMFLQICQQTGIEPLILIQPVKGVMYDQTIYNQEVRAEYYQRIRDLCDEYGVEYADFSNMEYETYFLKDYSHPSALGWAYYDEAIWNFATQE